MEGDDGVGGHRGHRLGTARALLGTLLLSTGTPMLLGGDERWRTQCGNNNAYCRDDGTSWVDWAALPEAESLTAFVARLTAIRRSSPDLHRDRFYRDGEVLWWHPAGRRIGGHDWHDGDLRTLGLLRGDWLLILHAGGDPMPYVLPPDGPFVPELDSTSPDGAARRRDAAGRWRVGAPGGPLAAAPPHAVGGTVGRCRATTSAAASAARPSRSPAP